MLLYSSHYQSCSAKSTGCREITGQEMADITENYPPKHKKAGLVHFSLTRFLKSTSVRPVGSCTQNQTFEHKKRSFQTNIPKLKACRQTPLGQWSSQLGKKKKTSVGLARPSECGELLSSVASTKSDIQWPFYLHLAK